MWRRPLEWNLNGTTEPRDGSVDHLSPNSLKDRHGPIRAPKSFDAVGFFLSGHPLEAYDAALKRLRATRWADFVRAVRAGASTARFSTAPSGAREAAARSASFSSPIRRGDTRRSCFRRASISSAIFWRRARTSW